MHRTTYPEQGQCPEGYGKDPERLLVLFRLIPFALQKSGKQLLNKLKKTLKDEKINPADCCKQVDKAPLRYVLMGIGPGR